MGMTMNNPQKRPVRFFNTTGPCNPWDHYMLPPADRLVGAQLHRYIRDKLYWVLHAPRQTGKTTFLKSWAIEINSDAEAAACYVSVERCQGVSEPERSIPVICEAVADWSASYELPQPPLGNEHPQSQLKAILRRWSELVAPKPLIVLFDEVDVLEGNALISFLRQLRDGFADRGTGKFPISIALVGMRDLKDFLTMAKGGFAPNPGSPFNIKSDSAVLSNFSQTDTENLFAQRTEETGQAINKDALGYVYEQSMGQPWIVNSLFARATMRVLDEASTETVTLAHIKEARLQMTLARETHLDALAYRLRDARIKKIIEPIIIGDANPDLGRENSDVQYAMDMGLIKWNSHEGLTIANPIYTEIITRNLNSGYHDIMPPPLSWMWRKEDGSLDMDTLLKEFQKFWRKHSEIWEQKADYTEAFPHLLLMAFLQRVLNGGGRIDREYAAGRGRMDLAVEYNMLTYIIEIKLIYSHDSSSEILDEGLEQTAMYRDKIDKAAPAYLIIFDRRPKAKEKPWEQRLGWEVMGNITVVRC